MRFVRGNVLRNLRDDRAARGGQRLRDELMAVETLALDGEEGGVGLDLAAVDDDGVGGDVAALHDLAAGHLGDLAEGQMHVTSGQSGVGWLSCSELRRAESISHPTPTPHSHDVFSSGSAALTRSRPFPRSCPAIANHPPARKAIDGAGTEHLSEL